MVVRASKRLRGSALITSRSDTLKWLVRVLSILAMGSVEGVVHGIGDVVIEQSVCRVVSW